jgi:intracellular septation protein A
MKTQVTHKPRPMVDLLVGIVVPSLILMKLSGDEHLGAAGALILALSLPLGWGLFELVKYKKFNFIAILGLVSVLLTGGIGLLELDTKWLAIKEAAIPGVIGLVVFGSTFTQYPLIRALLFNRDVMNVDKILQRLEANNGTTTFEKHLLLSTYLLAMTFIFSAVMNYILVKLIVTSPAGSEAFNEQLGELALYSYPAIAIPSMLMMMGIFYFLWRTLNKLTGLTFEEVLSEKLVQNN